MQTVLKATYIIITPMFLGDADKNATGIRPPSIKGALRFWWRALQWGVVMQVNDNDHQRAVKMLHQMESKLFGSAVVGKTGAQSEVLLRHKISGKETISNWPGKNSKVNPGSNYLGYGLCGTDTDKHRDALKEGQVFTVELLLKSSVSEEEVKGLEDMLKIFGLVGGLGGRVRRGFGSVSLTELNGQPVEFESVTSYVEEVRKLITVYGLSAQLPPYTAFSKEARFSVICEGSEARAVHNKLGLRYKAIRGELESLSSKIPFGLPLKNYNNRRSSPLIMHLHQIKDKIIAVSIFLPADFHYEYSNISYEVVERFFNTESVIAG